MKHTTLYRKWRPRRFGGIVGQEPVVRTLRRAIETDRVSHAYLFSGPRGTGKTSTAKVLAMGLNCEKGPTPEPDGTCESCRAIMGNFSMDVLEMDAASNRGIDEIRDLRDKVNLAPASGRMKVYIIDEVHMLTAEAFNALLKMLEEPPEHVVFVLATTEKHKVLPTIISRCQSFDFKRPSIETLVEKLREISEAEGIEVEPEALTVIAREGRGSFRDAEGLLDQLSSFAEGRITASMVRELLGGVGPEALLETTYALHERRAADALRIVDRLSNEGKDLGQFVGELLSHLRNLMLLPYAPEIALAGVGADERAPLEEQAGAIPTAGVVRLVEALGDSLNRIRRGGDPKLELELVFLKLTRDYTEPDMDALFSRLEALEKAKENSSVSASLPRPADVSEESRPTGEQDDALENASIQEEALSSGVGSRGAESEGAPEESSALSNEQGPNLATAWDRVIRRLVERRPDVAAVYKEATIDGFEDGILKLSFPEELSIYTRLAVEPKREKVLLEILAEHVGESPRLEFRVAGNETAPASMRREPRRETSSEPGAAKVPPEGHAAEPRQASEERPPEAGNGSGGAVVEDQGSVPEATGGEDTIRDQSEVFEIARETGLFDENKDG